MRPTVQLRVAVVMLRMPRVLMICFLVSLCWLGAASAEDTPDPIKVSLVSLIADPAAYEGKRVKVTGYLTTAHFEDCAIYLSKGDFDRQITKNAVRLQWSECFPNTKQPPSLLSGRFAVIEGRFRRSLRLDSDYSGVIENVTQVGPIPSRTEFYNRFTMPWWQEYRLALVAALFFVALITSAAFWIARAVQSDR